MCRRAPPYRCGRSPAALPARQVIARPNRHGAAGGGARGWTGAGTARDWDGTATAGPRPDVSPVIRLEPVLPGLHLFQHVLIHEGKDQLAEGFRYLPVFTPATDFAVVRQQLFLNEVIERIGIAAIGDAQGVVEALPVGAM